MQCVIEQYKEAGAEYTFSTTKALHPVLTEVIFENWKPQRRSLNRFVFYFVLIFCLFLKQERLHKFYRYYTYLLFRKHTYVT